MLGCNSRIIGSLSEIESGYEIRVPSGCNENKEYGLFRRFRNYTEQRIKIIRINSRLLRYVWIYCLIRLKANPSRIISDLLSSITEYILTDISVNGNALTKNNFLFLENLAENLGAITTGINISQDNSLTETKTRIRRNKAKIRRNKAATTTQQLQHSNAAQFNRKAANAEFNRKAVAAAAQASKSA